MSSQWVGSRIVAILEYKIQIQNNIDKMNCWKDKYNYVYWKQEHILGEWKDLGSSVSLRALKIYKAFLSLGFPYVRSGWLDLIVFNVSFHRKHYFSETKMKKGLL